MNIKRMSFILLSMVLSVSILASCQGKKADTNKAVQTQSDSNEASMGFKDKKKLTVELFDRNNTPASEGTITNNRWTKWVNEEMKKYNIEVSYFAVPRNEEADKLNVLMASGDAPDIVFTYDRNTMLRYALTGGIYDLDSYMDTYGQNIKKYFGDEFLNAGRMQGKLYSIPARRAQNADWGMFIRYDWLDKLGMSVPETPDQLYSVLRAFKDNPEKLGTKSTVPVGSVSNMRAFVPGFVKTPTEEQMATQELFLWDGYVDALKFVNRLYREGMIDHDYLLDKNEKKLQEQFVNNQIGMLITTSTNWPWKGELTLALSEKVPDQKFMGMKPLKNKDGKFVNLGNAGAGMYLMIPKTSKNPEACIKYLDWMVYEGGETLYYGIEGEHYVLKDGIKYAKDEAYNAKTLNYIKDDICITYNMAAHRDMEMQTKLLVSRYAGKYGEDYMQTINSLQPYTIKEVLLDKVIESEMKMGSSLKQKVDEMTVKCITETNAANIDKLYEACKKDYLANGGQQIIDEKKKAYNDMKSRK